MNHFVEYSISNTCRPLFKCFIFINVVFVSEQTILYLMGIAGTNFCLNLNHKTLINLTLMIFFEINTIFLRVAYQGKFTVVFRPGVAGAVKIVTKSGDLVRGGVAMVRVSHQLGYAILLLIATIITNVFVICCLFTNYYMY